MSAKEVTVGEYTKFLVTSLENADAEKQHLMKRFEDLTIAQQEMGDLRAELVQRTKELHETQHQLSEQRVALHEEREKVARLMNENAVLCCQLEDDRYKIQSLLNIRKTETTGVLSMEGNYPIRVTIPKAKGNEQQSMSLRSLVTNQQTSHGQSSQLPDQSMTINPPASGLVAALSREIDALKQLLDEQRKAFNRDRSMCISEERMRCQRQDDTLAKYSKTVDHLQQMLTNATKELCEYRHRMQISERQLKGDIEALEAQLQEARRSVAKERARKTTDMQIAVETANSRSNDLVERLRSAAKEKEEAHQIDKERLERTAEILEVELVKVKGQLSKEKKAKARNEERHKHETEGLQQDVNLLKQQLRAVEKKVYFSHMKNVEDEMI